jgi:hypothetical protein
LDKYRFAVAAGEQLFVQPYSSEELKFLTGNGCLEIPAFRSSLGLRDNFSVSKGMNTQAWTTRDRVALLTSTLALRDRIRNEQDLFANNYSFREPGSRNRSSNKCWIGIESGEVGFLMARHSGQLYFDVKQPDQKIIDVRAHVSLATIDGIVRLYRKPNELRWLHFLNALIDFLASSKESNVAIRHDFASSGES